MYVCDNCGKSFTRKYGLKYHNEKMKQKCRNKEISKIKKINGKVRYCCSFCSKTYSRQNYLDDHIENIHGSNIKLVKKDLTIEQLKKQIEELQSSVVNDQSKNYNAGHDINIDNSINNNNYNNILCLNVNAFSHTSMEHLDDKLAYKAFINLFQYLPQLLAETNFNQDHPENHNVYLKNVKNKIYKVFDGLGHQEVAENIFFKHFIDNYLNSFDSHITKLIDENKIESNDKRYGIFEDNCSELEYLAHEHKQNLKTNKKYRKLYDSLFNVFTSNKDLVKDTMDKQIYELSTGQPVELNYKDDTVQKQFII